MDRIRFLSLPDVVSLHEDAMLMADQPPAALIREDLLESALSQAKQVAWYTEASPAELAVHLTTHIALAHSWVDGNKRTASYAGLQFAARNGAKDPSLEQMLQFGDLLLKYIEASHEGRNAVFAEFVKLVENWFD